MSLNNATVELVTAFVREFSESQLETALRQYARNLEYHKERAKTEEGKAERKRYNVRRQKALTSILQRPEIKELLKEALAELQQG